MSCPVFQLTVLTGVLQALLSGLCAFSLSSLAASFLFPWSSEMSRWFWALSGTHTHTHQDLRRKGTMGVWGFPYPWPLEAKATLERWWRWLQTLHAKKFRLIQNSLNTRSNKTNIKRDTQTQTYQDTHVGFFVWSGAQAILNQFQIFSLECLKSPPPSF